MAERHPEKSPLETGGLFSQGLASSEIGIRGVEDETGYLLLFDWACCDDVGRMWRE